MNNIYSNISGIASSVKRMGKILSVLFLLVISSNAWADADKYYLLGGTGDNYRDWTPKAETTSKNPYQFVFTVSQYNNYVNLSSSTSYDNLYNIPEDAIINYDSEIITKAERIVWDGKKEIRIDSKSAQTLFLTYDGNKTYTIGRPSWRLCGQFTDWTPANAPEFTGSGSTLSLQVYLPYQTNYPCCAEGKGFKIVAHSDGFDKWYGNTGTITASITNWTFSENSGDGYNCGINTNWSGYYTFTFDTSSKELSVTYPDAVSSTPIARWGDEPTTSDSSEPCTGSEKRQNIVASAYIASQGCGSGSAKDVKKIKVRFWNADAPTVTDAVEIERTAAPYFLLNNEYSITIPYDNDILLNSLGADDRIVMDVAAYNDNGWSAYSDQMEIDYTACPKFIVHDLTPSDFTACDGSHQFLLKNMVKPVPTTWSVTSCSGTGAKATDFTLTNGVMVWDTNGKEDGSYTYNFKFGRSGFDDASASITFAYDHDPLSSDIETLYITSVSPTAVEATTTPWTELTLTATYPSERDFTGLEWSVDKASGFNLVSSAMGETTATATFKGSTLFASTEYNITVKGTSDKCVTTTGKGVKVTVNKDTEDCSTTVVLRGANPVVEDGPRVTLNGYIKKGVGAGGSCINDYTTYGFCYSITESKIDTVTHLGGKDIVYKSKTGAALSDANRNWSYTVSDGLTKDKTYYYRAYVVRPNGTVVFSDKGIFVTGDACVHPVGDPINYYIDDDYDDNDPCALQFKTLADAIANLKTHQGSGNDDWWDDDNDMLKVNVIFNVYPGTYGVSKTTSIDVSGINRYSSSVTPTKRLTIVGTDATNKPVIYGLNLAESRFVTLQYLKVVRETTGTGLTESSIVIGFADKSNTRTVGEMTNSGLEFIKCDIDAQAFCCIHANGVNGLYMTGCNLKAKKNPSSSDVKNDLNWGASIKFMNCKNIKMLRNNFRGTHGTNIFFQNSRDALIMNNVFWNDNEVKRENNDTWNYKAFIRLITYGTSDAGHKIANVGMYYNTMYLKDNSEAGYNDKTDFLVLGGQANGSPYQTHTAADYDFSTIEFMYNNCYSYDDDIPGKTSDAFCNQTITSSTHITHNNFWSVYGSADFSFGNDTHNVNMSLGGGMMCSTAPYDPDGLIIKGSSLNMGSKISTDISGMGAESISDDRLRDEIRPASGSGWTYGAYQQTLGEDVDVIYWLGTQDKTWDNRNNWYKLVNGEYQLVTCVDNLSNNLKAVIPEQTGETKRYPIIPEWTDPAGRNEGVYTASTDQFAKTIDIQYGASIMGVENLKEGASTYRYFEGITHLDAGRKEWLMVGTVICPFKDYDDAVALTDTTSRLVVSGDFYRDHLPHIYMQQFGYTGTAINWDAPFTALDESVPYDRCFTIFCADQYGPKKRTAYMYYGDASKGTEPIKYEFKGRFAAEKLTGKPSYSFTGGQNYFVNNYYPANVLAKAFSSVDGLTVKAYDPVKCGWNDVTLGSTTDFEIRPQSGVFVMASKDVNNMTLKDTDFSTNSTKYKSAGADQGLILSAVATATGKGSNIGVWQYYKNITKAENASDADVCELYMPYEGINLSTLSFADADTTIALGIHNKLNIPMSIKFELIESSMLSEVYLEDRSVEPVVRYDLLAGEKPYFANLESGYTEGRFYLVLGDGSESEHDIPTPAKAEDAENFNIDAFVNDNVLTVSVSSGATIGSITLFDMAGRAYTVPVNGKNFSQSELTVAKGIYTVTVVTDRGTETKKVVVK